MFSELVVLLPCHSLDDFPYHLEGSDADGLLAAWSVLWHPALVAGAGKPPTWHRVDSPPMDIAGWLIVVPEVAAAQLPVGYVTHARETGATVILRAGSREEILAAILAGGQPAAIAPGESAAHRDAANHQRSIPSWWPISGPWAIAGCRSNCSPASGTTRAVWTSRPSSGNWSPRPGLLWTAISTKRVAV